jgi:protein-L-isoaspartate(D-aspartate) O-methyltransferase
MVDCQIRPSDVTLYPIIDALLKIPRENYVPAAKKPVAYAGAHIDLGGGRVVLDPRVFAKMLDALNIGPEDVVLDIGCGLGYSAAVIAELAEAVIAVEEDATMAAEATRNLTEGGADNAVVIEKPLVEGAAEHGPYDVIMIEGAVHDLPPGLTDQLKDGGRIVAIFDRDGAGHVRLGVSSSGAIAWRTLFDASAPVLQGFTQEPEFQL